MLNWKTPPTELSNFDAHIVFLPETIQSSRYKKTQRIRPLPVAQVKKYLRKALRLPGSYTPRRVRSTEKFISDGSKEQPVDGLIFFTRVPGMRAVICYGLSNDDTDLLRAREYGVYPAHQRMFFTSQGGGRGSEFDRTLSSIGGRDDEQCWHLRETNTRASDTQNAIFPLNDAAIGFLDTGVWSKHKEFSSNARIEMLRYDTKTRKAVSVSPSDDDGHGTAVLSLVAGTNVGVCPGARAIMGSVFTREPSGNPSAPPSYSFRPDHVMAVVEEMVIPRKGRPAISVLNISYGFSDDDAAAKFLLELGEAIYSQDVIVVSSIGNDSQTNGPCRSPGNQPIENVIGVGATNRDSRRAKFSNYGPKQTNFDPYKNNPNISAPGVDVPVASLSGKYELRCGTSYSSAIVAAIALRLIREGHARSRDGERRNTVTRCLMRAANGRFSCHQCGAGVAQLPDL